MHAYISSHDPPILTFFTHAVYITLTPYRFHFQSSPKQTRKEYDEVEVETETEDEEIIEREVDKRVIKEFKVPQVIARHSYEGEGLNMKKGEVS